MRLAQEKHAAKLERRWIDVDGATVHYRVATDRAPQDAPTVVLVHGLGISSRYMIPLLRRLAGRARAYAPDLPGFGHSDKPRRTLTIRQLADALAAWIDAVGLDRPALLGNSLGCQFIIELAVRHPRALGAAILQGPTVDPYSRSAWMQIPLWLINGQQEPPSQGPLMIIDYALAGLGRVLQTFRYALDDRPEEKLPYVEIPTLVVRGSRDWLVSQRWAEEATALLPRGRLVVIPGGPHTINYVMPLELSRVTLGFLRRLQQVPDSPRSEGENHGESAQVHREFRFHLGNAAGPGVFPARP